MFDTAAVLMVTAAVFAFINYKTLELPFAIAITIGGLFASLVILLSDLVFPAWGLGGAILEAIHEVDFPKALLNGMLSFLLFAGALHVDFDTLRSRGRSILTLATFGVVIATTIVGGGIYFLSLALGAPLPFIICLLFGAIIAPTDPVAVLGIMKAAGAPVDQEVTIVGESLFNDGVGVVVFTILATIALGVSGDHDGSLVAEVGIVLLEEVGGGMLLGMLVGYVTYRAMRVMDEPHLEVFMSVACVMLITSVALQLHFSAPLGCVVAGLFIGNQGRALAMSDSTRHALDLIWEFIDETLNAILFLLVGLEVVYLFEARFTWVILIVSLLAVPLSLMARMVSVSLPILVFRNVEGFTSGAIRVLTWGGLKGGISVALALSLPAFEGRALVVSATYAVVIFSIVVQGLTVGKLVQRMSPRQRVAGDQ